MHFTATTNESGTHMHQIEIFVSPPRRFYKTSWKVIEPIFVLTLLYDLNILMIACDQHIIRGVTRRTAK